MLAGEALGATVRRGRKQGGEGWTLGYSSSEQQPWTLPAPRVSRSLLSNRIKVDPPVQVLVLGCAAVPHKFCLQYLRRVRETVVRVIAIPGVPRVVLEVKNHVS